MKVYEIFVGQYGEKTKRRIINEIMKGVIKITYPDGTTEYQEPCPLFFQHIQPLVGRDTVIERICAEVGECNVKKCWRKYFELEVNNNEE